MHNIISCTSLNTIYYGGEPEQHRYYQTLPHSSSNSDILHHCTKDRDIRVTSRFQSALKCYSAGRIFVEALLSKMPSIQLVLFFPFIAVLSAYSQLFINNSCCIPLILYVQQNIASSYDSMYHEQSTCIKVDKTYSIEYKHVSSNLAVWFAYESQLLHTMHFYQFHNKSYIFLLTQYSQCQENY